jgi:hypothetical protein
MKVEDHRERKLEIAGWPVNVASYRLGSEWHARADNVSPGATVARGIGATREEAEQAALRRAGELLGRTKRHTV